MKKPLISLMALTASVISSGAIASNLENPLYMPKNREVYLKTGAAVMYKEADTTKATLKKETNGNTEFPIWRFTGDIGYGITDRLDVHGHFGYTRDNDISRQGMHRGRIGLMYRLLTEESPIVWDIYGDAYLSGISPMKGVYTEKGFNFGNYSNGRWGAIAGTRFGKTFKNDLTLAAHVEYLQTFGNHNNKIAIDPALKVGGVYSMKQLGFPDEISVNLKSTHETVAGFDAMYQVNTKWSIGGGFEYIEHTDNSVKSIHTKLNEPVNSALKPIQTMVVEDLLNRTRFMKDGWDEYVLKANVAYAIDEDVQIAFFAEYTWDDAHSQSQNGTDEKIEAGFRLNARF